MGIQSIYHHRRFVGENILFTSFHVLVAFYFKPPSALVPNLPTAFLPEVLCPCPLTPSEDDGGETLELNEIYLFFIFTIITFEKTR